LKDDWKKVPGLILDELGDHETESGCCCFWYKLWFLIFDFIVVISLIAMEARGNGGFYSKIHQCSPWFRFCIGDNG